VFLRVLYLIPLLFVVLRNGGGGTAAALAAAVAGVVFVTGQLAGSLAWITISTEDSPDLLASAPAGTRLLRRAKLAAAMLPIAALLFGPLLALLWLSPGAGLIAAAACGGAALSSGLVRLWHAKPAKRADFNKREKGGGFLVNLAEVIMGAGWSTAAYLGVRYGAWGLIPAGVIVLLLLLMRRPTPAYVYG
jgi:ABC-2 type transport system permease protein